MIRGVWSREAVGLVIAAALLPVVAAILMEIGAPAVPRLVLSALVIAGWQVVFRVALGVAHAPAAAVTAVAVALCAPPDTALWQVLLAVSFGSVIGELVFGGWGRNFLNAGVVSLAFLYLSVPNGVPQDAGTLVALAALAGGALLLATGILAASVAISAALAFALAAAGLGTLEAAGAALGTYGFALVFLAGDPVAAAATRPGRWVYGALAGALAALISTGAPSAAQAAVFAVLLAQIFAPLVDQAAIAALAYQRKRRHG